jgi:oligosaccharyltransferase complex subunit alpha (ribophorin I)
LDFFSFNTFESKAGLPFILKMRLTAIAAAVLSFTSAVVSAEKGNLTKPLTSRIILPSTFKPPQVFKNINLVHLINLEKSYPKEQINVVIENIAKEPQDEYFIPFTSQQMETIGGLEVRDKKNVDGGLFEVDAVEFDTGRYDSLTKQQFVIKDTANFT